MPISLSTLGIPSIDYSLREGTKLTEHWVHHRRMLIPSPLYCRRFSKPRSEACMTGGLVSGTREIKGVSGNTCYSYARPRSKKAAYMREGLVPKMRGIRKAQRYPLYYKLCTAIPCIIRLPREAACVTRGLVPGMRANEEGRCWPPIFCMAAAHMIFSSLTCRFGPSELSFCVRTGHKPSTFDLPRSTGNSLSPNPRVHERSGHRRRPVTYLGSGSAQDFKAASRCKISILWTIVAKGLKTADANLITIFEYQWCNVPRT